MGGDRFIVGFDRIFSQTTENRKKHAKKQKQSNRQLVHEGKKKHLTNRNCGKIP